MKYFLLALLVIGFVFGAVAAIIGMRNLGKSPYTINTSSPTVIKQLQKLSRYETASFTVEKVIDAGTKYSELRQLFFGDQLLLIAHGEVIAGFDLSLLSENDIKTDKEAVTLNLPKPQILLVKLDSNQTRVYNRQTGIFTRGDKDLESQARSAAEQSIKDAACQGEILDKATENGRTQLTALLKALGFTTVVINVPQAHC